MTIDPGKHGYGFFHPQDNRFLLDRFHLTDDNYAYHLWDCEIKEWVVGFPTSPSTKVRSGDVLYFKKTTVTEGAGIEELQNGGSGSTASSPQKQHARMGSASIFSGSPMKRLKLEEGDSRVGHFVDMPITIHDTDDESSSPTLQRQTVKLEPK